MALPPHTVLEEHPDHPVDSLFFLEIRPDDRRTYRTKVNLILQRVEVELGIIAHRDQSEFLREPGQRVILCVEKDTRSVVGLIAVEKIDVAHTAGSHEEKIEEEDMCGVHRLWVAERQNPSLSQALLQVAAQSRRTAFASVLSLPAHVSLVY